MEWGSKSVRKGKKRKEKRNVQVGEGERAAIASVTLKETDSIYLHLWLATLRLPELCSVMQSGQDGTVGKAFVWKWTDTGSYHDGCKPCDHG